MCLFEPSSDLGVAAVSQTAVAAHELFGLPIWATISATIMQDLVPPAGVRRVPILADHDTNFAGQLSAFTLARSLDRLDLAIELKIPPEPDRDWLDMLNGVGGREG